MTCLRTHTKRQDTSQTDRQQNFNVGMGARLGRRIRGDVYACVVQQRTDPASEVGSHVPIRDYSPIRDANDSAPRSALPPSRSAATCAFGRQWSIRSSGRTPFDRCERTRPWPATFKRGENVRSPVGGRRVHRTEHRRRWSLVSRAKT